MASYMQTHFHLAFTYICCANACWKALNLNAETKESSIVVTVLIDFLSYPTMRDQTIMNLLKKEKAI